MYIQSYWNAFLLSLITIHVTDQLIVRKRNSEISNFFALLVSVKISEHDRLKFIYSYFDLFISQLISLHCWYQ